MTSSSYDARPPQCDLAAMSTRDVENSAARSLVVPLGSLEQHGPHLPLATDTMIAAYVAERLAAENDGIALAPPIPLGASGEHSGFAGTLSIGTDALATVLVELVRDSERDYDRVVVVNGHGGNATAIARAQGICTNEGRHLAVLHCHFPGGDAHAGRTETSVMLHIAPDLVRADLAAAGATEPVQTIMAQLRRSGIAAVSPNGVLGDPRGATAAEGEQLLIDLIARLRNML